MPITIWSKRRFSPGDGYVTNLQLREGMLVGGAGGVAVMSFILDSNEDTRGIVVAAFKRKKLLANQGGSVRGSGIVGYPGEIFTGRVLNTIDISGVGQLSASGILPDIWAVPPGQICCQNQTRSR